MNVRIIRETPDGIYSEIFYLDDNGNSVDETVATCCIVRECRADGTLIREIWGTIGDTDDDITDDIDYD